MSHAIPRSETPAVDNCAQHGIRCSAHLKRAICASMANGQIGLNRGSLSSIAAESVIVLSRGILLSSRYQLGLSVLARAQHKALKGSIITEPSDYTAREITTAWYILSSTLAVDSLQPVTSRRMDAQSLAPVVMEVEFRHLFQCTKIFYERLSIRG